MEKALGRQRPTPKAHQNVTAVARSRPEGKVDETDRE